MAYYRLLQIPVELRGEPAVMVGKPGVWSWDEVNPGTAALIDSPGDDRFGHARLLHTGKLAARAGVGRGGLRVEQAPLPGDVSAGV